MKITGAYSGGSSNCFIGVANAVSNFSNVSVAGDVVVRSDVGNLLLQAGYTNGGIKIDTNGNVIY